MFWAVRYSKRFPTWCKRLSFGFQGTRVGVVQYSHSGTFQAIRLDDPKIDSLSAFKVTCLLRSTQTSSITIKNFFSCLDSSSFSRMLWSKWSGLLVEPGLHLPSSMPTTTWSGTVAGPKPTWPWWSSLTAASTQEMTTLCSPTCAGASPCSNKKRILGFFVFWETQALHLSWASLCSDPSVDVSAIGIGDMFDQIEENESLKSIACQKDGRVLGMRRFADLVAEEFIDKIETVLCPGTSESKMYPVSTINKWNIFNREFFL